MAEQPEHDVFVSYAHDDNDVLKGAALAHGWITTLAANLNAGPGVRKKRLFIDHQLQAGDAFGHDLLSKLEHSSVLLLLLSQNYIDSKWCGTELAHFIQSHGNDAQRPADVFVVELSPFEDLERVPERLRLLREQLLFSKFWHRAADAAAPNLAGHPSPGDCSEPLRHHYWAELSRLQAALDGRLRALQTPKTTVDAPAPDVSPPLATVLLADCTDDLSPQRDALRRALEPEGILVLPEGDYYGLSSEQFNKNFKADLTRSELFVQLLSPTPGRQGRGFEAPLPQLQYQQALQAQIPVMQWCETLPASDQISEPAHKALFATPYLRATHLTEFGNGVIAHLRRAKEQREREAERLAQRAALPSSPAPSNQPNSRTPRKQVFIDDLAAEADLSGRLRAIIKAQNYTLRSLPVGAPLGNSDFDIQALLRPCLAGLTIYTERAEYINAYSRLVYYLNQMADGHLPMARWGVLLLEGTVASEFGIDSDEVVEVNEVGLADFLSALSPAA